jgi:hypothetical protein
MEKKVHYRLKRKEKATNLKDRLKYIFVETNKVYELLEGIDYVLSNSEKIHIPKGFETDLRSVPPFLEWLISRNPETLLAYIVHDFLYITDYKRLEWGDKKAKEFADKEMLLIAENMDSKRLDNKISYIAVKWFGKRVFKKWQDDKL